MAASGAVPVLGRGPATAPWVGDALLAAGVSLTLAAFIAADVEGTQPQAWAYLWAAGFGALMFIRRSYPTLVVALSVIGFVAYYASGYTAIGTAVPIAAAVFSAAECGRLAAAVAGSAAVAVISVVYRLATGQEPAFVLGYDLPQNLLILAGAIALGDSLRTRRTLQRQAGTIAQLTAERYRLDAQERLAAERLAVSRDLHDSIGHSLAVISLHTEVACEAAGEDPGTRDSSLDIIHKTTAEAVAELKRTVAGLRGGSAPDSQSIESLGPALASARAAGLEITLENTIQSRLPDSIQTALYRIIQESVTNTLRHSTAGSVLLALHESEGTVHLRILDDGAGPGHGPASTAGEAPGYGLAGLRERVEALGGSFTAGWTPGGFQLEASLPLENP